MGNCECKYCKENRLLPEKVKMRKKNQEVSTLRKRYSDMPKFYNENGNVILCGCGNIADFAMCKPNDFSSDHSSCYDCMLPFSCKNSSYV